MFFLPVDPRDERHKDPEHIDFSVPRRARYVHSAWKRHQDAVFWVDIDLAINEGLTFYQIRSNAIILQGTLPAHCISKVERLKIGEILYERRHLSPRPPPKISLKHDHNWNRGNDQSGSTVEQQPVGKLVQQSFGEAPRVEFSKPTQSKPNPICDRSGKPEDTERVFVEKGKTSRSQEIDDKRLQEELGSSDGSGKPEKLSEDMSVKHAHDGTGELVKSSASTHSGRICSCRTSWHCIIKRGQQVQPCNRRGEHRFQHPRSAEFDGETITWRQRSQLDSEDREPPSATSTSK